MLLAAVMSLSGVQTLRQHISVDFITNRLPAAAQEFIKNIFGPLLGVVFSGLIVYSSWNEAMFALHANEKTITGLKILTFPYKLAIPIFVGLLTLVLIVQITRYIISLGNRRRR
jgi:TRAP-type C4-dicarboxylate transport system permease small subunit